MKAQRIRWQGYSSELEYTHGGKPRSFEGIYLPEPQLLLSANKQMLAVTREKVESNHEVIGQVDIPDEIVQAAIKLDELVRKILGQPAIPT
jgi:hypothetical protein